MVVTVCFPFPIVVTRLYYFHICVLKRKRNIIWRIITAIVGITIGHDYKFSHRMRAFPTVYCIVAK